MNNCETCGWGYFNTLNFVPFTDPGSLSVLDDIPIPANNAVSLSAIAEINFLLRIVWGRELGRLILAKFRITPNFEINRLKE